MCDSVVLMGNRSQRCAERRFCSTAEGWGGARSLCQRRNSLPAGVGHRGHPRADGWVTGMCHFDSCPGKELPCSAAPCGFCQEAQSVGLAEHMVH